MQPCNLCVVLQVDINDGSSTITVNVTIKLQLINDEPPRVDADRATVIFFEDGKPVPITGPSATIQDSDNMPEHQRVDHVCADFMEQHDGDEIFLNSSDISVSKTSNGSICIDVSSCNNDFSNQTCFNSILTSIIYNNTEDEPVVASRVILLTVSKN